MAIEPFPAIAPSTFSFGIRFNTQINVSPLSGAVQTIEIPGARWVADMTFTNLDRSETRELVSFLAKLKGSSGRFYLTDKSHPVQLGNPGSSLPVVLGANQTGSTLNTEGWEAGGNNLLLPGDYIEVNNELKVITEPVTPITGGLATINFSPPLRRSPPDNTSIIIADATPKVIMMLSDNEHQWATDNSAYFSNLSLSCAEAF